MSTIHNLVLIFRFITGLGVGGASFTLLIYCAECAPTHLRGALTGFMQMTVVLGLVWAGTMNLAFRDTNEGWRWALGICMICPIFLMMGIFFCRNLRDGYYKIMVKNRQKTV
eukprot:UN33978